MSTSNDLPLDSAEATAYAAAVTVVPVPPLGDMNMVSMGPLPFGGHVGGVRGGRQERRPGRQLFRAVS